MWGLVFSLVKVIPGLAEKFLDWQVKKANVELEGFKTGATTDLEAFKAYLAAQTETNRMKLAQNAWWGAKLIILIAGVPSSCHFAAMMLDSFPFPYFDLTDWLILKTHIVGSWKVPAPPPPYDTYQWAIVQSFFIVMPVMPIAGALSQWLARKR